jgi:hypothetical protein
MRVSSICIFYAEPVTYSTARNNLVSSFPLDRRAKLALIDMSKQYKERMEMHKMGKRRPYTC